MTYKYNAYQKNIEKYTNQMNLKQSIKTERKGKAKVRDSIVNIERFYTEGYSYISLILSFISMIVTWTALSSMALMNFNIYWGILIIIIVSITIYFGYLCYTKFGLVNRLNEFNGKTDSGRFQLWSEIQEVKSQNIAMLKQMDNLITYHKKMNKKRK